MSDNAPDTTDAPDTDDPLAAAGLDDVEYAGEAPDDPAALASKDDLVIERYPDTGEVVPVWEPIPGEGQALVRPFPPSEAERALPDSGDPADMADRKALRVIKDRFVHPDFSDVDDVDELPAFALDGLLTTVMNASRLDISNAIVQDNEMLKDAQQAMLQEEIEKNSTDGNSSAE